MNELVLSAIGVGGSTLIGSLLGYFVKNVSHRTHDAIIGFCAGVMLSAATLGLLVPAFSFQAEGIHNWIPLLGVIAGVVLLNVLDYITPHLHHLTGIDREVHRNNQQLNRVLLFTLAIALHKFPEGMAAGVGFSGGEVVGDASRVAIAISLQNVPESMVIITPLLMVGVSPFRTFIIALCIGLLQMIGVFTGHALGNLSEHMLPFMLALSGGAMLYVVSDEMIPESHSHGYEKLATYALITGFLLMILME